MTHAHDGRREQITVPVKPELKARLEAAAEREDRTLASYVRRLCTKALDGEREGVAA